MDTIYSLASGRGKAGVAVIRISGLHAMQAVIHLTGSPVSPGAPKLRRLTGSDGDLIDQALVLSFEEGHSFTGETVVELQTHGSPAVVSRLLSELRGIEDFRLSEAGEFTRRALENGCLDLTQVEGLADLIEAETEAQRKQAVRVFDGAIGDAVENWRTDLIRCAALLEATIDFVDEDVPVDVTPEVQELTSKVLDALKKEYAGARVSERIRDGFEVAIIGPPNIGKSTLLNTLAGRDAAITSEIAGTTRDIIEVRMDLDGLPVTFLDTAGLRSTADVIEAKGIERALRRSELADLRVVLSADGQYPDFVSAHEQDILCVGKADLGKSEGVSGLTGKGVDKLMHLIQDRLMKIASGASTVIRERHIIAISETIKALEAGLAELDFGHERLEIAAEEYRRGVRSLEIMVGRIDVEDLLDHIFASFCLGK